MLTNPPVLYDFCVGFPMSCLLTVGYSVLNVKAVLVAFNQEKALVGAFSVIVQLQRLIVYTTSVKIQRFCFRCLFTHQLSRRGEGWISICSTLASCRTEQGRRARAQAILCIEVCIDVGTQPLSSGGQHPNCPGQTQFTEKSIHILLQLLFHV